MKIPFVNVRLKSRSLIRIALILLALLVTAYWSLNSTHWPLLTDNWSPLTDRWSPLTGHRTQATAPSPVQFSPPSGPYSQAIDVRLSSADPGTEIYFTTDGSLPTAESGTLYSIPIHITAGEPRVVALRARELLPAASLTGTGEWGPASGATYFMNMDTSLPLLSLTIDPQDLWDEETGIFANPLYYGLDWERPAEMAYYDEQLDAGIQLSTGVRVHGARSRNYDKKSLRLYLRGEYGQPYLEFPIFPDSEKTRFKRLVVHDGGQDFPAVSFNGTLLRNELVYILARQAGSFAPYSRPALLFINGEPWGIYQIRERIDDRYLEENFQIKDADLLSGFEYNLQASSGDTTHWDHLMAFVDQHDLTDQDNYNYVETQVNLDNLIDYSLIQIITANADWPHNNQLKFRDRANGRWHWIFWDSDFAFGLMPDSYIEKNMFAHIFDQEDERLLQSSLLLRKLLENPDFKSRFLARLADLLNTVFTTENVLGKLNPLAETLAPDISHEIRRWLGSGDWEAGVEYMREFTRQRPDIVRAQAVEAFDLTGLSTLTINAASGGQVTINGGSPLDLPWQGTFFQGVDTQLTAVPDPGYRFLDWGPPDLPAAPDLTLSLSEDLTLAPRFVRYDDQVYVPGSVLFSAYGSGPKGASITGLQGDWVELHVAGLKPVDLRGWRVSDNDTLTATDEGSLIFGQDPALAQVLPGTTILLVASQTPANDRLFADQATSTFPGSRIILYAGSDSLDGDSDPWFNIGEKDTLYLLAPGSMAVLEDDIVIDSLAIGQDG